jgi:benzoylformate decarboxylase
MSKINGRSAFLRLLASEGVEYLFGNPGTTELAIMEALGQQNEINYVLGLQESVVVAMADGYARASGRIGAKTLRRAPGVRC